MLKADLRSCVNQYGEDATVERAVSEAESNTRIEWSRRDEHEDVVTLSLTKPLVEEEEIELEKLRRHPWVLEMEQTLEQAFVKLNREVESEKNRIAEIGDLLGLIRLRLRLLRRKLWMIDLGFSPESSPSLSKIPESIQGRERAVQYCWMILVVIEGHTSEWPTQSELAEMLRESFNFDSIPVDPESAVEYASEFMREEFSGRYQGFRPDFYKILQDQADSLSFFIGELETDLLDQADVPD
jgi:hypothetical protein